MYVCFKTIALPLQNSEDKGCGRSSEYFRIDRPTRLVKMGLSAAAEVHFYLEDAQQVGGRVFLDDKARCSDPIRPDRAATCLRAQRRWSMMSDND